MLQRSNGVFWDKFIKYRHPLSLYGEEKLDHLLVDCRV